MPIKIVYAGHLSGLSNAEGRRQAFLRLGCEAIPFDLSRYLWPMPWPLSGIRSHLQRSPDFAFANLQLLRLCRAVQPDLLWVDKGLPITATTLRLISRVCRARLVHYNPDDPFNPRSKGWPVFLRALPYYDVHFVARQPNVTEYREHGAREVFTFDRGFDPVLHRRVHIDEEDRERYAAPAAFVGTYTARRHEILRWVQRQGARVEVWGNGWPEYAGDLGTAVRGRSLSAEQYVRALNCLDIALHFVRAENRDEQDSRTFEIPACGTFMLAERTPSHERIFVDSREAALFRDRYELLDRLGYYLEHPQERRAIAEAGYHRCHTSGYDHDSRLRTMLGQLGLQV